MGYTKRELSRQFWKPSPVRAVLLSARPPTGPSRPSYLHYIIQVLTLRVILPQPPTAASAGRGGGAEHLTERLGGGLQPAVQGDCGVHADRRAALGAAHQRAVHARVHRRHGVVAARVFRAERRSRILRIPRQE